MKFNLHTHFIGFLIGSNIYIGLIAASLAIPGFIHFNQTINWMAILFIGLSTMCSYNLQRYFKWRKKGIYNFLQPYTPKTNSAWCVLIGLPSISCGVLLFFIPVLYLKWLIVIGGVTLLYLFIHPTSKRLIGLRYIPFTKSFIIAFCWTFLYALFSMKGNFHFLANTYPYWIMVYLQVWIACVLFDIRDQEIDKGEIVTFANAFGVKGVLVLWLVTNVVISLYCFTYCNTYLFLAICLLLCIWLLQALAFKKKLHPLWFTFWVDGSLAGYAVFNYCVIAGMKEYYMVA